MSGYVSPSLPGQYKAYQGSGHSEHLPYLPLTSTSHHRSNCPNAFIRKYRPSMPLALWRNTSAFIHHVLNIVFGRPLPDVRRIHAIPSVAGMTDELVRVVSMRKKECKAMSADCFPVRPKCSIPGVEMSRRIYPAITKRFIGWMSRSVLIHGRPESFFIRPTGWLRSRHMSSPLVSLPCNYSEDKSPCQSA